MNELKGVKRIRTIVALISPSIIIAALRTCSLHKSICQESGWKQRDSQFRRRAVFLMEYCIDVLPLISFAVQLLDILFYQITVLV